MKFCQDRLISGSVDGLINVFDTSNGFDEDEGFLVRESCRQNAPYEPAWQHADVVRTMASVTSSLVSVAALLFCTAVQHAPHLFIQHTAALYISWLQSLHHPQERICGLLLATHSPLVTSSPFLLASGSIRDILSYCVCAVCCSAFPLPPNPPPPHPPFSPMSSSDMQAALNIDNSVSRIGLYGSQNEKLWCLSHTETLHLWEWVAACDEESAGVLSVS